MNIRILDYRPPKIAQFFLLVAGLLHWATPMKQLYIYSNYVLAVIIGFIGFAVMIWGWGIFKKFDTAICPTAKNNCLVTSGIYKYSRNPMYLGVVTMLLAIAMFVGTLPFYIAVAAFFAVINMVFCPYEEEKLYATFGEQYQLYKNTVRRWF